MRSTERSLVSTGRQLTASRRTIAQYDFIAIPRNAVRRGDLYANNGTITKVVPGPRTYKEAWKDIEKGCIRLDCGPNFSCTGDGPWTHRDRTSP